MFGKIAIGAAMLVVGWSIWNTTGDYNEPTARDEKIMTTYKLSFNEAKAYKACAAQMTSLDFKPSSGVRMTKVPQEVCVCQSRTMARHFLPGKYSDHSDVLSYVSGEGPKLSLSPEDLIDPSNPRGQFLALASAVNLCAGQTAQRVNQNTQDKVKELCEAGKLSETRCAKILK